MEEYSHYYLRYAVINIVPFCQESKRRTGHHGVNNSCWPSVERYYEEGMNA